MREEERLHCGIAAAQVWRTQYFAAQGLEGFLVSLGVACDAERLAGRGSIAEVARLRHASVALNRLSIARVDAVCLPVLRQGGRTAGGAGVDWGTFARDLDHLREFGSTGVPILTSDDFVPNASPGRFSRSDVTSPAGVEAHLHKASSGGLGLVVSSETRLQVGWRPTVARRAAG
jgi:hypothetical protein